MMPSKGTKYTTEIQRLREQGLSDAKIAERLSIGRSIIHRNIYKDRTQQRLAKLMTQAGLYALKQVLVSCEVGWRWVEGERLKLLEGKSSLTAENIGTLMRSQEKALDMAKAFLGKTFSPEGLAKVETADPRLKLARERLQELEGHGRTIEEDEDHNDHDS
jgi:hypothetical protein